MSAPQEVWLVGGVADVYACEVDAWQVVVRIIQGELAEHVKSTDDREIILTLLEAGKVALALKCFNKYTDRPLGLHKARIR